MEEILKILDNWYNEDEYCSSDFCGESNVDDIFEAGVHTGKVELAGEIRRRLLPLLEVSNEILLH